MTKHSKYKGVSKYSNRDKREKPWKSAYTNKKTGFRETSQHETEKQAAKAYDIKLIKNGLEPVNILIRKPK